MTKKRKPRKPEQIVKLLQQGDAMLAAGKSLGEVYQKLEVTESTWQRWKKQFGGMKSDEAKRLQATLFVWPLHFELPSTNVACKTMLWKIEKSIFH